jgi:hypothetical protein
MVEELLHTKKLELVISRGHPFGKQPLEVEELIPLPDEALPALPCQFTDENGEIKEVTFTKKPLGIIIAEKHPKLLSFTSGDKETVMIVSTVPPGGHGFTLGVKPGWKFVTVNGEQIPPGIPYDEFSEKMKAAVQEARLPDYRRVSLSEYVPTAPWQAEPVVAKPNPWDPQLTIEFTTGQGATKEVTFVRAPLGLTFCELVDRQGTAKLIVQAVRPGTHAFELFVKEGWQFSKVAGDEIPSGMSHDELSAKLRYAVEAANLPQFTRRSLTAPRSDAALERLRAKPDPSEAQFSIEFTTDEGTTKEVTFTRAPLGLTFCEASDRKGNKTLIVQTVRPGTHAFELFVEEGWTFTKVAGEEIPSGMAFEELSEKLRSAVETVNLPVFDRRSLTAKDPKQ